MPINDGIMIIRIDGCNSRIGETWPKKARRKANRIVSKQSTIGKLS
ncbi:Transposase [Caenorhabditis elegans]|uniref:Transposase n=1 Tax=Caenorhabditis elegans TaxID=6239 RepID=I2HAG8_CAEEL|nr:Transposase [Caenorhabditis elegans]CCH63896.1 Transposase [Caenorhabditis elegans]|eukprot:NP_001263916.1 Uncharacterized protein CELE_C18D4.6 [Caenorhabditis elegans]